MLCPACQTENKDGAKFCRGCGTALALRCATCGAPYEPGDAFCDECGSSLAAASSAAASAVNVAPPGPVAHEPAAVGSAELRMVSVLFVDLVGFTALSENREAEDVRELLGTYFERTRTIIERHGGTVEKFIGDAVMAVWGAPVAREDDAERAVRTALEIVDTVTAFGSEVGAPELRARAGVVTGQVAALENPGEGLVVGDRVNTASRVQSAAQPGSVFVDEVTRQVTSAAIAYADGGEHAVKGKAEPLHLWRAVRVLGGVGGSDREETLEAAFVGREADVRLVKELFHAALDRRSARLLAVSGDAGVGKSRLRREFFNYIDGLSNTVLWHSGRCLSHGEGVAYWALGEMIRQRLGIAEEASAQEARERLEAGLERWVPDPTDQAFITPRLGALLGIAEPGLDRQELFAGWRLFFERLADHEPVALVFEDVQWADAGLLDFIEGLLDWSATSPIFILTLSRPELAVGRDGWPAGHRGATLIRLEPLEDSAMRELLADLVDGLPTPAADQIVAQAQGVPLYAIETIRALADRGVLVERAGRLVLQGELGRLDVPASLSSLLSARLDALAPGERALVKAMSVFGGSFPRSAAATLGDLPDTELDETLAALVRKGILVIRSDRLSPDRGQYAFGQGLLRTVAYERLSRGERKARHLAAAEHLRRVFPNDGEDVAEVIATHLLDALSATAGDPDEAELRGATIDALRRAGQRAGTIGAPETAERVLRTASELADDERERAELQEAAAEMARRAGSHAAALELFERVVVAHDAAGRPLEAARVSARVARMLVALGRGQEAPDLVEDRLATLHDDAPPEILALLNNELGYALTMAGRSRDAGPFLEIALELASAHELSRVMSHALAVRAMTYDIAGRTEEADALYERAVEVAERHDHPDEAAFARANAANLRLQRDRPGATERLLDQLARARRRGEPAREMTGTGNLLQVHLLTGRWDEIDHLVDELLGADDARPFQEHLRVSSGTSHVLRGRLEEAQRSLGYLDVWAATDRTELRDTRTALVVCVSLAGGSPEAALEAGRAMLSSAIETDGPASDGVRFGWPHTLDAALQSGRIDAAREVVGLLERLPIGHVPPYLRAHLARGRALTAAPDGQPDSVETDLVDAIDRFRSLAYPYWLAVVQTDLAEWLIGQGRPSEAEPLLDEAIAALETLGAAPALARARSLRPSPSEALSS